jgi:hypothetical protein
MNQLFAILMVLTFVSDQGSPDKTKVYASLEGFKKNAIISRTDFMKVSEISLSDKEYTIVSFSVTVLVNGMDLTQNGKSNKITEDMKKAILDLRDDESEYATLIIKKIIAKSNQGKTIKIRNLVFKLKL